MGLKEIRKRITEPMNDYSVKDIIMDDLTCDICQGIKQVYWIARIAKTGFYICRACVKALAK